MYRWEKRESFGVRNWERACLLEVIIKATLLILAEKYVFNSADLKQSSNTQYSRFYADINNILQKNKMKNKILFSLFLLFILINACHNHLC